MLFEQLIAIRRELQGIKRLGPVAPGAWDQLIDVIIEIAEQVPLSDDDLSDLDSDYIYDDDSTDIDDPDEPGDYYPISGTDLTN